MKTHYDNLGIKPDTSGVKAGAANYPDIHHIGRPWNSLAIQGFYSRTFDPDKPLRDQVCILPKEQVSLPQNCKNCGAPLKTNVCGHCDTRYL